MLTLFLLLAASVLEDALRAGLIALQRGDLSAAQANLEAASRETPRDGRVWVALSQTYWHLHREADAETAADKAAALAPGDPAVLQGLAIYYSETGRKLQAARAEAQLSSKLPGDRSVREKAGELYFAAARPLLDGQRFAEAAAVLEEATERVKGGAQLELALGVAAEALWLIEKAIALGSGADGYFEKGAALDRPGKFADAAAAFEKAAQPAPAVAGNPLPGPAPVCLRNCSKRVGPAGGSNPKSSTRCQLPVTMLAVELKWERTPELTQLAKKWPSGRRVTSRGMLCWPSGAKVSE